MIARRPERGSLSVFFAVMTIFLLAMAGLVAEGGRRLANMSRAEDLASEAARAAASTLDPASLALGLPIIDQAPGSGGMSPAWDEAAKVVAIDPRAQLISLHISPTGRTVTAVVEVTTSSWIPSFDLAGTGSHTAQVFDPEEVP